MHVPVCQHWVWQPEHTHTSVCCTLYHATSVLNIVPCKSTMKKHIVQRHNAGIVPMVKNGHNTRHTLPLGTARRHRFAEITREEDRWPQKNCPQKTGGKKGIGGGLDLKAWMKGSFQQNYDRWGLCEACVAQAKVLGPMWLMAELTDTPLCVFKCTLFALSLFFNAELALFVAIFQFVGTEGRPFMFGRMTTDLGDKSRFPPNFWRQVWRGWIAKSISNELSIHVWKGGEWFWVLP